MRVKLKGRDGRKAEGSREEIRLERLEGRVKKAEAMSREMEAIAMERARMRKMRKG